MFHYAFADLEGEVQSGEGEVALLKLLDNMQRVKIVIEASAVRTHERVKPMFAGVAEWRMANIVNHREPFNDIGLQMKRHRHRARDFQHFHRE
jgi:hypothetical protein